MASLEELYISLEEMENEEDMWCLHRRTVARV